MTQIPWMCRFTQAVTEGYSMEEEVWKWQHFQQPLHPAIGLSDASQLWSDLILGILFQLDYDMLAHHFISAPISQTLVLGLLELWLGNLSSHSFKFQGRATPWPGTWCWEMKSWFCSLWQKFLGTEHPANAQILLHLRSWYQVSMCCSDQFLVSRCV